MPLTDTFGRMPLGKIHVAREARQREDPNPEKGNLLQSIALRGVMQAIILEREPDEEGRHRLYAGERRYLASVALGLEDIPFRFAHEPDAAEVQIIELEENLKRQDLTWQETVKAVAGLHELYRDRDPSWTQSATAEVIAMDKGHVSAILTVWGQWADENVSGAGTLREAYNLLQRRFARAKANVLEEWLGGEPEGGPNGSEIESETENSSGGNSVSNLPSSINITARNVDHNHNNNSIRANPVVQGDFASWAEEYSGPKFNLVHCDFPYGVNLANRNATYNTIKREDSEMYSDEAEVYRRLLRALVANFDKFGSESCHLLFWYSNRAEIERATREELERIPGMKLNTFPLIWFKSDNAGIAPPGRPRHVYETCLLGTRGDRPIVRVVSDVKAAPTNNLLHVSAKPVPVVRHFMEMLVDEHSRVLDPTCGSGTSLIAAEELKAERILGMDLSPEHVSAANREIEIARRKRNLARNGNGK